MLFKWIAGSLRRQILGISADTVRCSRRGFVVDDPFVRDRLEHIGGTFVLGYRAALCDPCPQRLALALESVDIEDRGFAFEGAAMAVAMLDILTPWRRDRLSALRAEFGDQHDYMLHVGAGWALARLRRSAWSALERGDPLLRWMMVDGYGFHEGFFRTQRTLGQRIVSRKMTGYAARAFDQGLGRSLWFVAGADPERIARTIAAFPTARYGDMWSGIGLACAYAGGVSESVIQSLTGVAAEFNAYLAQGVAFAAKARERARNPAPHTELACEIVCGRSAAEAAAITDDSLDAIRARSGPYAGESADHPAFEAWRSRIRAAFAGGRLFA